MKKQGPSKCIPGVKYGKLKSAAKMHNMKGQCYHPGYKYVDAKMYCSECNVFFSDNVEEQKTIEEMYQINPNFAYKIIQEKLNDM